MKALSVRSPYAWFLVHGRVHQCDGRVTGWKDVENRGWYCSYRGRVWIHVGSTIGDKSDFYACRRMLVTELGETKADIVWQQMMADQVLGALTGQVDSVACMKEHPSVWAMAGQNKILVSRPSALKTPIPYKGRLGLFEVDTVNIDGQVMVR